jgi:hypothetical protein
MRKGASENSECPHYRAPPTTQPLISNQSQDAPLQQLRKITYVSRSKGCMVCTQDEGASGHPSWGTVFIVSQGQAGLNEPNDSLSVVNAQSDGATLTASSPSGAVG